MALPPELKPSEKHRVMDLMRQAGIDVSDWASYGGGSKSAAANPKYCYEWALKQAGKLVVCNLWYQNMQETNGTVEQHLILRDTPDRTELDPTRRARRDRMKNLLMDAVRDRLPVRVIVLDGRPHEKPTDGKARVEARVLDPVSWAVVEHPRDGEFVLRRGGSTPHFLDQFSLPRPSGTDPKPMTRTSTSWARDPGVRRFALQRAGGRCEYCGIAGFKMPDGSIYLETHHVIPLSEGGPDSAENVVALCPNHHREAHFGETANTIRTYLQTKRLGSRGREVDG
jgi:hypothetical protein